jgi:hypothetical protein
MYFVTSSWNGINYDENKAKKLRQNYLYFVKPIYTLMIIMVIIM